VIWSWSEGKLTSRAIPRDIYADELAKRAFSRALRVDPGSLEARAGLARSYAVQIAKLEAMAQAGQDVEELKAEVDQGGMSVLLAGSDALDAALTKAAQSGDVQSGIALARVLGDVATRATPGLLAALGSKEASLRSEAALALADIALTSRGAVSADVVAALAAAAGREVVRIAFVIDGDTARAATVSNGLESRGVSAHAFGAGADALAMLHRIPGVDAVLVADSLPDLTTDQVIDDLRSDPRFENTPILVLTANEEQAGDLYGESTQGLVTDPSDLAAVEEAMSGGLDGDRAQANTLAAQAAQKLAGLAVSGKDISSALDALASTLVGRPDAVILPAIHALHLSGGDGQAAALISVLANGDRSDEARVAAGQAAGAIFSRGASGQDSIEALSAVMASDDALSVRKAAAQALGSMNLDAATRAKLLGQAGMLK
jgi:CheY-like chemotaxis protein